jgi:hypothetical protein
VGVAVAPGAAPAHVSSPPAGRLKAPALVGVAGAGLAAALLVRDPHTPGSWPPCPFLALTGVPCPGCGGLRAVRDLVTGDLAGALSSNAWAVLTVVLVCATYAVWVVSRAGGERPGRSPVARGATAATAWLSARATVLVASWGVGLVAFGALRLLPALSVLRP